MMLLLHDVTGHKGDEERRAGGRMAYVPPGWLAAYPGADDAARRLKIRKRQDVSTGEAPH